MGERPRNGNNSVSVLDAQKIYRVYRNINASLKSIAKNGDVIKTIEEIVCRSNVLVTRAYQFIRMYLLHVFHNEEDEESLPTLDIYFFRYCLRAVGQKPTDCGRSPNNLELLEKLNSFYSEHFQQVLGNDTGKVKLDHMSNIILYLATEMHTAYHANLKRHFVTRLTDFVNKTVSE